MTPPAGLRGRPGPCSQHPPLSSPCYHATAVGVRMPKTTATATRPAPGGIVERDSRLGADAVIGAVRRAVAAWVLAVDGDETALAAVAEPQAAHFLLHPSGGRWQVAPGPAVTLIQIWGFEPEAEPPRVRASWRFTGRRGFTDPGP